MKAIISFDGDLLISKNQHLGMKGQLGSIIKMTSMLGKLVINNIDIVITHGNAPQIGFMLLRGEAARHVIHSLPLDICGADTQGATGYMLQQSLSNWLDNHMINKDIATIVTQVIVDETIPANAPLQKGIGPFFDWERKQVLTEKYGWSFEMVPGEGNQRVVPCLIPKEIVEIKSIKCLIDQHIIVICAGGGGIPVRKNGQFGVIGVEAVIDKAYTTMLLADEINSDLIAFVSPIERIINTFDITPNDAIWHLNPSDLSYFIKRKTDIEDTMIHKLIAIKQHLNKHQRKILIIPPEQLPKLPNQTWGVEFMTEKVNL